MGLRWSDIDLDRRRLEVRRPLQQQRGKGLVFVEPKSRSSRRSVTVGDVACNALAGHAARQDADRRLLGAEWQGNNLVFCSVTGGPFSPEGVNFHLNDALRKAELPRVRVHDLRHTAASLLLAEGIHPKVVQEMLGHSSISLTVGTYSHVPPTLHAEAAYRTDKLFPTKGVEKQLDKVVVLC